MLRLANVAPVEVTLDAVPSTVIAESARRTLERALRLDPVRTIVLILILSLEAVTLKEAIFALVEPARRRLRFTRLSPVAGARVPAAVAILNVAPATVTAVTATEVRLSTAV